MSTRSTGSTGNMDPNTITEMQARILQLESELQQARNVQHRVLEIEQKLATSTHGLNGPTTDSTGSRILVNKPVVFTGSQDQSLDSFLGHMELYLAQVPSNQKFNVAVSFLGEHAFDWFKVTQMVEPMNDWDQLQVKLKERFEPVNKVQQARNKLAIWKQKGTVAVYNENFLKIIIDIPAISTDEVIDRYTRGLKSYISTELCTHTYTSLNKLMTDALRVESAKRTFSRSINTDIGDTISDPMDISNTSVKFRSQKEQDRANGACYYCHEKGCMIATCPKRKPKVGVNNSSSGKEDSQ